MTEYALIDGQRVALTEWFPTSLPPVHPGAYQLHDTDHRDSFVFYRYWDGKQWFTCTSTPRQAKQAADAGDKASAQVRFEEWRGLSHPPGAT